MNKKEYYEKLEVASKELVSHLELVDCWRDKISRLLPFKPKEEPTKKGDN